MIARWLGLPDEPIARLAIFIFALLLVIEAGFTLAAFCL